MEGALGVKFEGRTHVKVEQASSRLIIKVSDHPTEDISHSGSQEILGRIQSKGLLANGSTLSELQMD